MARKRHRHRKNPKVERCEPYRQDFFSRKSHSLLGLFSLRFVPTLKKAPIGKIDTEFLENIKSEIISNENGQISGIIPDIENSLRTTVLYKTKYSKFLNRNLGFYIEPTACSSLVINKKGFFENDIKKIDRKMIAVEMEGYGVVRAVNLSKTNSKAILVKCVMDKTENKDENINNITPEENKDYAALVSALFVKKLIEKDLLV